MAALMWSMVLLGLVIMMGGLFLCSLLKGAIRDDTVKLELRLWLFKHYGSSLRAIYTLFEVTLAGCWPQYFRPLIEDVSGWYVVFVMTYITLVVFAMLRIITALFLKKTLQIAADDNDEMLSAQRSKVQKGLEKLSSIFAALDVSGDGRLSVDEFERAVSNSDVKTWLQVLEMEVHDVDALFQMIDDGDGFVTYDEFLQGIMRLKGQARTLDVIRIANKCDRIDKEVRVLTNQVHRRQSTNSKKKGVDRNSAI